jgi:tetratricopeptide (TPR) repeat protein
LISYITDDKRDGDVAKFQTAPGKLPASETEGPAELEARGKCFTNIPNQAIDYVSRPTLEGDLKQLLLDDKRPIVTLVGRGGIGKTSLALRVLHEICESDRYSLIVWLSARDVDLQLSGPKPVRPSVLSPKDMSRLYASLVLSDGKLKEKGFDKKEYFEAQLQNCEHGKCLFVFDNFETTQNPVDVFNWVDAHVRLPNKVLITTRLRDFKGDYPVDVHGMLDPEANQLIENTASGLNVEGYIDDDYKKQLIQKSEGHPYVIKVLLGEVAKLKRRADIPRLLAGTEDILIALFERTYAALSPCAQRAFLTLAGWASPVPKLALEAVLYRSTEERSEVENGIESLIQYSMAELHSAADDQEFLSLPLVTSSFGKKKLNIHPAKPSIQADVEILQMLGPSLKDDKKLGLNPKIQRFISSIARRIEEGATYEEYAPIIEAICLSYNPGWFLLGRWHVEQGTEENYRLACDELRRFLENAPDSERAADAWKLLAIAYFKIGNQLGEVHAFVERAHSQKISFNDLSSTANKINKLIVTSDIDKEHKRDLARRLLKLMEARESEADADDFARMAWMALTLNDEDRAKSFVTKAIALDEEHYHLINLRKKFDI